MREFKKQWSMRWDELLMIFALEAGMFLVGQILLAVIVHIDAEGTLFEIGTVCALAAPLFILVVFMGGSVLALCFNMGISMGATRRSLVPMTFVVTYLECLAIAGIAYLFHHLELWIFRVFYAGMENEMDLAVIFRLKYILPACLVCVAVQALFGTLFLKYGKTAFWILWAIYMFVMVGGPRISDWIEANRDAAYMQAGRTIWNILGAMTENNILTGLTIGSVILILLSYAMLRRQQVQI